MTQRRSVLFDSDRIVHVCRARMATLAMLAVTGATVAFTSFCDDPNWEVVWRDEFEGRFIAPYPVFGASTVV